MSRTDTPTDKVSARAWWTLIASGCMIVVINLDMTIGNIALPTLARVFQLNLAGLSWIINAYLLISVLFFIPGGRFSDKFGRKIIFMIGAISFVVGSFVAGFSVNYSMLLIGRFVQGLGLAFTLPHALVLTAHAFPESRRGFATGTLVTITGVSEAIGPTVGGLLLTYANWRWIFFINIPFAALSLFVIWCSVKSEVFSDKRKISVLQMLLSMAVLFLVLYPLNQMNYWGVNSPIFWALFAPGVVLMCLFLLMQTRVKNPLIDIALFQNKTFLFLNVIRVLFQYSFLAIMFVLPIYMQNIAGFTPLKTGLILLITTVVFALLAQFTGRLIDRIGPRIPYFIGHLAGFISFILLAFLTPVPKLMLFSIALVLLGVFLGSLMSGLNAVAIKIIPKEQAGQGMSLFFTVAVFGSIVGVAVTTFITKAASLYYLGMKVDLSTLTPKQNHMLLSLIDGSIKLTHFDQVASTKVLHLLPALQQSYMISFHIVMWIFAGLTFIAACFIPFLRQVPTNK